MIKCVIFDLDGTLLDTIASITFYINRIFKDEGIDPITEEDTKIFIGNGARKLIKRALASRGIDDSLVFERILERYNREYTQDPYYLTEPYVGILELIRDLKSDGYSLAVLSNKPEETLLPVVSHFFGDIFDTVRGGRDSASLKPSPASTLAILSELGFSPSEMAFVGDSAVDIITAKNAEAALSIGVSWGFRGRGEPEEAGADRIADTADEIFDFIKGVK